MGTCPFSIANDNRMCLSFFYSSLREKGISGKLTGKTRKGDSSKVQVVASGRHSPFSCNPSKCSHLKCDRRSVLLLCSPWGIIPVLTGPPWRVSCNKPWMSSHGKKATEITQVCYALLEIWQRTLGNCAVFSVCISLMLRFLFQMLLFLLFYFGAPNNVFFLRPCLQTAGYFSFRGRDLPFISAIISLRWHEGELCTWKFPAAKVDMKDKVSLWKGHSRACFVF